MLTYSGKHGNGKKLCAVLTLLIANHTFTDVSLVQSIFKGSHRQVSGLSAWPAWLALHRLSSTLVLLLWLPVTVRDSSAFLSAPCLLLLLKRHGCMAGFGADQSYWPDSHFGCCAVIQAVKGRIEDYLRFFIIKYSKQASSSSSNLSELFFIFDDGELAKETELTQSLSTQNVALYKVESMSVWDSSTECSLISLVWLNRNNPAYFKAVLTMFLKSVQFSYSIVVA